LVEAVSNNLESAYIEIFSKTTDILEPTAAGQRAIIFDEKTYFGLLNETSV
jgi:hypothetical protein